jgi:SAM-dependent methyltransferase
MYRHDVRRVVARVGGRATPARRLLDVGCGRGLRLAEFRRAGFEVQAVDAQPEVVDYVRREWGVPAVCADVEQLDGAFEPESFDVIAAFYILEHVKDVAGTLRRCFNVLRPGGWLAATVPLVDSLQAACFGGCWSAATEAPRHVSLPSRAGLRQLCQAGGWTDVTLEAHSLWNCAGSLALSLVPRSNTSALYGDRRFAALFWRLLGAAVLLAATPWCAAENYIFLRPATGLLLARKPDGQTHVG